MADAFRPRFVDLVRNTTTTVGTGDFALGPAANGYTDFAAACQPGDSFYYSAVGVDKPAEREVGRGTLTAGGKISRDPIGGTKTNFTSGTKSIALIAAAEWFSDIQQFRANSPGINVKSFGAKGDSDETGSTGADDTAAIQAAIDHIASIGGGTLHFPEGYYRVTSYLTLCANLHVRGAGKRGSYVVAQMTGGGGSTAGENVRNGTAFYSNWPSNSSTTAAIRIEHMGFISTDDSNVGAAFYDNCGSHIQLHDLYVSGFKYGAVLDQSELVDIDRCEFRLQNDGGAGIYLVNGATLTPGNLVVVTNRISVARCQINQYGTVYGILDEGGYAHSFIDNNYNGCLNHLYLAGAQAFQVIGGQFEDCSGPSIVLDYRRLADGSGVGGSFGYFSGMMSSPGAQPCVSIVSTSGPISFLGNALLRTGGAVPVIGANNAYALYFAGNMVQSSNGEFVDSFNGGAFFDDRVDKPITTNSGVPINLGRVYAGKLVRCIGPSANPCTIQTDASALLPIGTTFELEQSTAGGAVTLTGQTGVTISGPTATSAQFQRLIARKRAANSWDTQLIVQNPLTQAITPASIAATGAITSSAGKIGYAAGAGGAVTQATSKSTGVTLNKLSGQVTMNAAALAPGTSVSFTLTNSNIAAGDLMILNHVSGGTPGAYQLNAHGAAAGSVAIDVTNVTAASLSEPIVIGFAVIKAVTA